MRAVSVDLEELAAATRRHPGIRGRGRRGRPSIAELAAAERCDCGVLLEGHPPLPAPLPLDHGRPCGRDLRYTLASGGMGYGFSSR